MPPSEGRPHGEEDLTRRPSEKHRYGALRKLAFIALSAAAVVGCVRAAQAYLRAPIDIVWPPRLDADAQEAMPETSPDVPIPLIDLPTRPGVFVREGELEGLRYLEVVFGETDPDDPLPLLVAIHGRADRPRVPGSPFDRLGRPVRVVLPAGPDRLGNGFAWFPYYVLQGQTENLARSARAMGDRLARFLRAYMAQRPTIGSPIVSGFSQGGILTWALALHHGELIEAAFPLATWAPPPLWPKRISGRTFPVIRSVHGDDDPTIPVEPSRQSVEALIARGIPVDFETFAGVGHYMSRGMAELHEAWVREALEAMWTRLFPPDLDADAGARDAGSVDGGDEHEPSAQRRLVPAIAGEASR